MAGKYYEELRADSKRRPLIDCLQTIGSERVYRTPSTLKLELMGREIISDLMDVFWEGAQHLDKQGKYDARKFAGKSAALISENYRRVFSNSMREMKSLPESYHRLQLVTDYVCG